MFTLVLFVTLPFQLDDEIAPKAGEANFEFSAAENAVPGTGFQF